MNGTWSGSANQGGGPAGTWSIRLVVKQDNYYVEYPSLNCAGHWSLVKIAKGEYSFIEHITKGKDICADGGSIAIRTTQHFDNMQSKWFDGGRIALGELSREK